MIHNSIVCGRVPWLYQYWPCGFMVLWFYVQELPKAQPAVVLVLKHLRRRCNSLKSHPTDQEKNNRKIMKYIGDLKKKIKVTNMHINFMSIFKKV